MPDPTPKFQIYGKSLSEDVADDSNLNGLGVFRSLTKRTPVRFPAELGEAHPFDMSMLEGLYTKFGFINAVVEKIVEYIWGGGIYVECENEDAKEVIEQWIQDSDFISIGREWTKESLVKGNGYLELGGKYKDGVQGIKVVDAKNMYVKRDDKGKVEVYNQLIKGFPQTSEVKTLEKNKDYIDFSEDNIVHLKTNKIGDNAYGFGIVYPNLNSINNMLGCIKDMHMLLHRKANVPYNVTLGDLDKEIYPEPGAVTEVGQKFEWLMNKHEWIHGPDMKIETLDFGNIGDKFVYPIELDSKMLFFGFQTPETLMGGAVNTGLGSNIASEHGSSFDKHIQSFREEIEKLTERKIFKRILLSRGFKEEHCEIQWGQPSEEEKRARIQLLQGVLGSVANPALRRQIELDIVRQLGYDEELIEQGEAEMDAENPIEDEEEEPTNNPIAAIYKKITKRKENIREIKNITIPEDMYKDYPLQEWIGYEYNKYTKDIDEVIDKDPFTDLLALNREELKVGYLTEVQVKHLKKNLKEAFNKGLSTKVLAARMIEDKVIPNLYKIEDGRRVLLMARHERSIIVARTETIRMSAKGTLENFKKGNINEVMFLAAASDRTCEECDELNGSRYKINSIPVSIPVHPMCRCAWSPVVG